MMRILKPGVFTTVQDLGRPGHQQFGIVVGGALDAFAARVANMAVGNDEGAALLEFAQTGPEVTFTADVLVAWTGADFDARIGAEACPRERPVVVRAGETLGFGMARAGWRGWLAVAGGIDVPLVLGSRSTYRRAGIGGHEGRTLLAGDELPLFPPGVASRQMFEAIGRSARRSVTWSVRPETLGRPAPAGTVRAIPGPEWEWFTSAAQQEFFGAEWEATREADRMGVRLTGAALRLRQPREMISSGVDAGTVQVPADGHPIVLLASHQTVGGYPRLASVISADLGRFTQLRPGERVRFRRATLPEAHEALLQRERDFRRVSLGLSRLHAS